MSIKHTGRRHCCGAALPRLTAVWWFCALSTQAVATLSTPLALETKAHAMAQAREATAALATAEELQRCHELVAERAGGEHSATASERGKQLCR